MILQFCGLSGAGKTTLAKNAKSALYRKGFAVEILDGDEYRKSLCNDLGFSKEDRIKNIRRMAFVAGQLSKHGIIAIISAINPYEEIREEISITYPNVKTVFVDCVIATLIARDTKGLYSKAFLPDHHPDKISNLSGINDPFESPSHPDLYINTNLQSIDDGTSCIVKFIESQENFISHLLLQKPGNFNFSPVQICI